jgi:hypothetical protein
MDQLDAKLLLEKISELEKANTTLEYEKKLIKEKANRPGFVEHIFSEICCHGEEYMRMLFIFCLIVSGMGLVSFGFYNAFHRGLTSEFYIEECSVRENDKWVPGMTVRQSFNFGHDINASKCFVGDSAKDESVDAMKKIRKEWNEQQRCKCE